MVLIVGASNGSPKKACYEMRSSRCVMKMHSVGNGEDGCDCHCEYNRYVFAAGVFAIAVGNGPLFSDSSGVCNTLNNV